VKFVDCVLTLKQKEGRQPVTLGATQ